MMGGCATRPGWPSPGLRLRHKRAHGLLVQDFVSWLQVEFLGTCQCRIGLLAALACST